MAREPEGPKTSHSRSDAPASLNKPETQRAAAPEIENSARGLPFKEPSKDALPIVETPEPTNIKLVATPTIDSNAAIDRSLAKAGHAIPTESASPYRLKQGNFGEKMATDALAQQGHDILEFKPDIKGTNQGGIDIVTMKDDVVYVVDNKAYTTGNNVSSVSALTKSFEKNIADVRERFDGYAKDLGRTAEERAKFAQAVEAIDSGRVQKVVTTAAFAPNGMSSADVSAALRSQGIQHMDLAQQDKGPAAAPSPTGQSGSGTVPAPSATRTATPPTASSPAPRPAPTRTTTPPASTGVSPRPLATTAAPPPSASGLTPQPQASSPGLQGGTKGGQPGGSAGLVSGGAAGPSPSGVSGVRVIIPSHSSPNGGV